MYNKPTVYRLSSVFTLIASAVSFLIVVINALTLSAGVFEFVPDVKNLITAIRITLIFGAVISVFFSYVEFSAMYCTSEVIRHQNEGKGKFNKPGFVFSENFYQQFGTIIYWVSVGCSVLSVLASFVMAFFGAGAALPATLLCAGVSIFWLYVTTYLRYRILADIMKNAKEIGTVDFQKDNNTSPIAGRFATFLAVICVLTVLAGIAAFVGSILLTIFLGNFIGIMNCVLFVLLAIILSLTAIFQNIALYSFYKFVSEKAK